MPDAWTTLVLGKAGPSSVESKVFPELWLRQAKDENGNDVPGVMVLAVQDNAASENLLTIAANQQAIITLLTDIKALLDQNGQNLQNIDTQTAGILNNQNGGGGII